VFQKPYSEMPGACQDEIGDFLKAVCPGITVKFWFGAAPREQAQQRFYFGRTSAVFVIHHAYDWHFRLYCFDFDAGVKACVGADEMPANLKTFLSPDVLDYDGFLDVSPQLPAQKADECGARVACFAKWFASSRIGGFTDRFDLSLYLLSVQNRMMEWRQVRAKIARGEHVPKLVLSPFCSLCPYDKCPTSVIGLPTGLTNSNSLCFLNQALVVLATSGPWSAKPNDYVGHILVRVLLMSGLGVQTEEMRNHLAMMLFDEAEDQRQEKRDHLAMMLFDEAEEQCSLEEQYSGRQQCIEECLRKMCDHLSGPLVTEVNAYTCSVCNASAQARETTAMVFIKEGNDEVMSLTDLIGMEQSAVHWRCSTPNCLGSEIGDKPYALGATFIEGALPDTILVVCKRKQFESRLETDIQIPFDVPVKTTNESCETTSELYSPIYVVLHSSGGDSNRNPRRSRFNVPDTVAVSVRSAHGGHYFGAVLETNAGPSSSLVFMDDHRLDKGTRTELLRQGQKVVVVALRKKSLGQGTVDLYQHALGKEFDENLVCKKLTKEWSSRHAATSQMCHRVANQVFIFLKDNDAALPCFYQPPSESRPRIVLELFKNAHTEQARRIMLTAIAIMWQVRITVHQFRGDPEIFAANDFKGNFALFLHNGVLFPTAGQDEQAVENITTSSGLRLGLLPARRGAARQAAAVFDTIIPIVFPLTVMVAAHDPGNENLLSFGQIELPQNKLPTLPPLPTNKNTTYWLARHLVAALCNAEASLLMRNSPNSTVIECSYAMIWQVVQTIERFMPFTDQSTHLILGCGRRGALLNYLMIDKDITLVGLDVSQDAVDESNQLIARVQATDAHFQPKIHVEMMNVDTGPLTSLHGFTSASRFAGGYGAGTADHTARNSTDEMVLSSPTMHVYWNNHLNSLKNLTLSEEIKSEWKLAILCGTSQEQSRFSTFLWFRVHPSKTSARVSSRVEELVAAANARTKRALLQYKTPEVRSSERVKKKATKASSRTPGSDVAQVSPLNVSPEVTPAPARQRRSRTPQTPKETVSKTPEIDSAPKTPVRAPQTLKETESKTPGRAGGDKTRKRKRSEQAADMNEMDISGLLEETGRNLTNEIEKVHQKMLAEIKRSNQTMNARLLAAEKKGISKPVLEELLKQSTAKVLQNFPDLATKLDETKDSIERLPVKLTSQMRAPEKTRASGPVDTRASDPEGVSAELRLTLSQLPASLAKALAPTGTQDGVLKAITDLTAGISKQDRDLLWIEKNRGEKLRKKAKKKKKKRKEKLAREEKEKEKAMEEMDQKIKLANMERKQAKKAKEERRKQELEEEKAKFLAMLKENGVIRTDRKHHSRASSPSSPSGQDSEDQDSASSDRSRSRSRGRSRRGRKRDRSKKHTSRDRDRKPRKNKSVLTTDEAGVGEWLESIHLGSFRKIFNQNNIVGTDLKNLPSSMLQGFGMAEHQLKRFVDAVAKL
jgi:hypothetical protein